MDSYRCTRCESRLEEEDLSKGGFCPFCLPKRPNLILLPKPIPSNSHTNTATELAGLIVDITDPNAPRWAKDQLEVIARAKAKRYLDVFKETG